MLASRHTNQAISLHHGAVPSVKPVYKAAKLQRERRPRSKEEIDAMVNRMGEIMATKRYSHGACTETDLITAGFTKTDIDAFAHRARQVATRITADRQQMPGTKTAA